MTNVGSKFSSAANKKSAVRTDKSESNLGDDYSDEQFESMSGSVSVSVSKSSKLAKVAKVAAGAKKMTNYSPIKEKVDEYAVEESKASSSYADSKSKSGQKKSKQGLIESSGDSSQLHSGLKQPDYT